MEAEKVGRTSVPRIIKAFFEKHPRFAFLEPIFEGLTNKDIIDGLNFEAFLHKCVPREDRLRAEVCVLYLRHFINKFKYDYLYLDE